MKESPDRSVRERFTRAMRGEPGPPCVGVTFISQEAIRALSWGESREEPLLSVVCSRMKPDFAFVSGWEPDAEATSAEVSACGTLPLWVVRGAFDAVATARGWSETLRGTVSDPGGLAIHLDKAVSEARELVERGIGCGAAAVVVAEDVGGTEGPLLAPDYVLSEIVDRIGRIGAPATRRGLPVIWHTDGDPRPFLEAAARIGVDAVHPGGLDALRLQKLIVAARSLGLVVFGGITGEGVRAGGPAAIRMGVEAGIAARGGGLLVSDDGGVATGEELGALIAALEAARG